MRLMKLLIVDQFIILIQVINSNPSIHYYCILCRKDLTNTVRIFAKLQGIKHNCFNFCPPCLCSSNNPYAIEEYLVCQGLNKQLEPLGNLTAGSILNTISLLCQNGIEDLMFVSNDPKINQASEIYQQMNTCIFKDKDIDLTFKIIKPETSFMEPQKPNPSNKKHLKALGYNWQRQEFASQADNVFGHLLGHLECQEEQSVEDRKLRHTIYKYFEKQKDNMEEINRFLVTSTFLLGRKGLHDMQDLPAEILHLRRLEDQVKEIISSVTSFATNGDSHHLKNGQQSFRNDEDDRRKKLSRLTDSQQKHKNRERSRSREKVRQLKGPSQVGIANYLNSAKSEADLSERQAPVKRRRGRPRGSKNRSKVLKSDESEKGGATKIMASKKQQLQLKKQFKIKEINF